MYFRCYCYYNRSEMHHGQCLHLYEMEGFEIGYASGPQNLFTQNLHFSSYTAMQFSESQSTWSYAFILLYKQLILVRPDTHNSVCAHSHMLTRSAVGACSFTVQSGFIAYDLMVILLAAIASVSILWWSSGKITCSGLIQKTHRTTLESLLQFELSHHNGRMRLPFFPCCVDVWGSVYMSDS